MTFDEWFKDIFPMFVSGKEMLEPYYGIAQVAYEQGVEDAKSGEKGNDAREDMSLLPYGRGRRVRAYPRGRRNLHLEGLVL